MKTSGTEEMYLITIQELTQRYGYARNVDIAESRGLRKSTVHDAIKQLERKGFVVNNENEIKLTKSGQERAKSVVRKHKIIVEALMYFGVSEESAEDNAGRIEHIITDDIADIIKAYLEDNSTKKRA